jgi:branched-chain amino acid aminotransferase
MSVGLAISIDGRLVDPAAATISVLDRGLLHGDGVFEILRTVAGTPVELGAHLARLAATAADLALALPTAEALAAAVRATVAAAPPGDHRVRVLVTRGPGPLTARLADLGPGRMIVIVEPLRPPPATVAVVVVDWPLPRRRGPGGKTLAYLDHLRARELAAAAGADEALRLDVDGHVAEGATSNLFVTSQGRVITPPIDGGVLPGVTRARILALCDALGIAATAGPITVAALRGAEEVFVTSAARGVVPVTAVDGAPRAVGPITTRLREAYLGFLRGHATEVGRQG